MFICRYVFYGPDGTAVTCIADAIWPKWWCKSVPSIFWVSEINNSFCEFYFFLLKVKQSKKKDTVKGKKDQTN